MKELYGFIGILFVLVWLSVLIVVILIWSVNKQKEGCV